MFLSTWADCGKLPGQCILMSLMVSKSVGGGGVFIDSLVPEEREREKQRECVCPAGDGLSVRQ